jgi:hypothetical protein
MEVTRTTLPPRILAINKKSEKNLIIRKFSKKKKVQALSSRTTRKACHKEYKISPQRNDKINPITRKNLRVNPAIRKH